MNNKKGLRILAVGLLSSVVLFGCSRKKDPTSTPTPDNSTPISETTSNGTSSSEKSDNPTSETTSNTTSVATTTTTSDDTSTTTSDDTSTTTSDDTSTTTSDDTSTTTSDDTSTTTSDTTSTTTSDDTSDTSSETSSSDVSSDDPIKTGATVKIGALEATEMVEIEPDPTVSNMIKQYSIEGVSVTAGDELVFTVDGIAVEPGTGTGKGNNVKLNGAKLEIVTTATDVNIYLKAYEDGGYDIWVTGYKDDTPTPEKITTVKIGEGEAAEMIEIATDPAIPNMTKQYSIEGVKVTAGDKLVFTVDGKVVTTGASGEGNNAKADASGLTIVSTGENVNIYLKGYKDGGYDVWVTKGTVTPDPVVTGTTVKIGAGEVVKMTEIATDPAIPTMTKQYSIEGVDVTAGDKLVFTVDGKVVAPGASGEGNNASFSNEGLTIVSTGKNVNIYLKAYKDGGYDVWVTKGSTTPVTPDPVDPVVNKVSFTVTVSASGWDPVQGNEVYYLWIWGGDYGGGQWVRCSKQDNGSNIITFKDISSNATGFDLVRMDGSKDGSPSWDAKWNQSSDVTFSKDLTSYNVTVR